MNETELIKLITQKLAQRQTSQVTLSCQENFTEKKAPETTLFFDNQQVVLEQVPVSLIHDLFYFKKDNPWVAWILTGLSYQVTFSFKINHQTLLFVPWKMLTAWPIMLEIDNRKVIALTTAIIKREEILTLFESSILVKTSKQKLTDEASFQVQKRGIGIVERIDETCIWGE
ncbi:PduM family microcompartment protein [Vagococcus intermedius]|uniref:PduM family microcompartment protein n=1 Tax=Vagococcus intermedius TaxID=2991418 RepID=A0AAF0I667_9ENTE|nr:PduM family microcompartment protein [Vagococcus intermedius]WEG72510.1 PduM family microcompartment protein [Vagococcus intermedius]WEG74597.1 PduM family microcompartment protein [Vagococcus intermedius]